MEDQYSEMERWVRKNHKKRKPAPTHKDLMVRFKKPLQECDAVIKRIYDPTQGGIL